MLTDKQIEREKVFCYDWYVTRKMDKTPTYADAIVWADKTMIDKARQWLINIDFDDFHFRCTDETFDNDLFVDSFRKAMEK